MIEELEKHFHTLDLTVTHSGNLFAGDDVEARRRELVERADVLLLLVSADFLASVLCQADAQRAIRRGLDGGALVAGVLARPCLTPPWVSRVPCFPTNGKPVTQWASRDEALTDTANGLLSLLEDRQQESESDCPFPGLEFFDEDRAPYFFGREEELVQAVELLGSAAPRRRWLQIEGASGAGKSSFARAGIVPAVRAGRLRDGPPQWHIASFYPGVDPVWNLARALHATLPGLAEHRSSSEVRAALSADATALSGLLADYTPAGHGVLLLVDQLEEALTLEGEALSSVQRFDQLLAHAIEDADGSLHLVTTMRSDCTARFAMLPSIEKLLNTHAARYNLSHIMGSEGLRRAIERPARIANLTWEPGLPERILGDALDSPGALPLVAHVLSALWSERVDNTLTNAAYERLGRVGGALARSADALVDGLGERGRERARKLLLRLVRLGQDGEKTTRKSAAREAVLRAAGGDHEAEVVLRRLSGGLELGQAPGRGRASVRLLTIGSEEGAERVELLHDALMEQWKTFAGWIREAEHDLALRREVEDASQTWEKAGRRSDSLARGAVLARLQGADRSALTREAQKFLDRAEMERKRSVLQRRLLYGVLLALLAGGASAYLLSKMRGTDRAAAEVRFYALQSELVRREAGLAPQSLLAVEAWNRGCMKERPWYHFWHVYPPIEVERALYNAVYSDDAPEVRPGESVEVPDAATELDGEHLRVLPGDNKVHLFTSDRRERFLSGHTAAVNCAVYSPDGLRIVTASDDGTVRIWRADGAAGSVALRTGAKRVVKAAFSRDGTHLIAATDDHRIITWVSEVDALANMACERAGRNFTPEEWETYFGDTDYRNTCDLGAPVKARRIR